MSQPEQKEQQQKGISFKPSNNSKDFWALMDYNEFKGKQLTGPKKTISKPEIKKKIPAQIPCIRCKRCLVDNPEIYDGVDRGYCPECWPRR